MKQNFKLTTCQIIVRHMRSFAFCRSIRIEMIFKFKRFAKKKVSNSEKYKGKTIKCKTLTFYRETIKLLNKKGKTNTKQKVCKKILQKKKIELLKV